MTSRQVENKLALSRAFVLSERDVDRIATRVVERLRDEHPQTNTRWLSATEVADLLGVTRNTVYERAEELGVVRIGSGPKPRLRFDRQLVIEATPGSESRGSCPGEEVMSVEVV